MSATPHRDRRWQVVADAAELVTHDQEQAERIASAVVEALGPSDVWKLRMAVGRWWRIKVEQDNGDTSYLRSALGEKYYGVVMQVAADIEHSSLLQRLLAGEEPEQR